MSSELATLHTKWQQVLNRVSTEGKRQEVSLRQYNSRQEDATNLFAQHMIHESAEAAKAAAQEAMALVQEQTQRHNAELVPVAELERLKANLVRRLGEVSYYVMLIFQARLSRCGRWQLRMCLCSMVVCIAISWHAAGSDGLVQLSSGDTAPLMSAHADASCVDLQSKVAGASKNREAGIRQWQAPVDL